MWMVFPDITSWMQCKIRGDESDYYVGNKFDFKNKN